METFICKSNPNDFYFCCRFSFFICNNFAISRNRFVVVFVKNNCYKYTDDNFIYHNGVEISCENIQKWIRFIWNSCVHCIIFFHQSFVSTINRVCRYVFDHLHTWRPDNVIYYNDFLMVHRIYLSKSFFAII